MTDAERDAVECALHWWAMQRPRGWSETAHMLYPTVNVSSEAERALARACSRVVSQRVAQ